jgi:hypothetical protein
MVVPPQTREYGRRVQGDERAEETGLGALVSEIAPFLLRAFEAFGQHGEKLLDGSLDGNGWHENLPRRIGSLIHRFID